MKYRVSSYKLQDGHWGSAFMPQQPVSTNGNGATFSEGTELGVYFKTKKEADKYAYKYLTDEGVLIDNIVIKDEEQNDTSKVFEL